MRRTFFAAVALAATVLSACGAPQATSPEATAKAAFEAQIIAAECAHIAIGDALTTSRRGRQDPSIMRGCPGYPNIRGGNLRATANLGRGLNADPRDVASRHGTRGVELFRKMIVRGIPEDIAYQVTQTPEFANTLALFAQYRATYGNG